MKKKLFIIGIIVMSICSFIAINKDYEIKKDKILKGKIIKLEDKIITLQDNNNIIYTFEGNIAVNLNEEILIKYNGDLNKNQEKQTIDILSYEINTKDQETIIPNYYNDNGIFKEYYDEAYQKLQELTLDEKISQLLLVRVPEKEQTKILSKYQFGGYLFFAKDFKNKNKDEVIKMITTFQNNSKIPLLTAVDEEGGKVIRISSNKKLSENPFKSSRELYLEGGFTLIEQDTILKSNLLEELGLNLNLAPVVDISTNPNDYIYARTLGEDFKLTATYAKTVIKASKQTKVSYTMKHFPGYGGNKDSHLDTTTDNRDFEDFLNRDLIPFQEGINAGCEAILISHNIIDKIDNNNPASLSPSIHNLLRNHLNFTGIIITDDLAMGATKEIPDNALKALLAGNDLIITTDYEGSIQSIKNGLEQNIISEEFISKIAFRILSWKYYKGLL